MTVAAFGAAGSAISLSLHRHDKDFKRRLVKGISAFVAGIACAVLGAPLAAPHLERVIQVETGGLQPLFGFLFGIAGYEICKVVYFRTGRFLNRFADKKEHELLDGDGDRGETEKESKSTTEEVS